MAPRQLSYGGAPMPLLLATRLMETFPESGLRNIYGLTESGPCGTTMGPDEAFEHLGTVGRPQVGVGIRVLDADGYDVPNGEAGEIAILSEARMTGYLDNEDATKAALDADGWLRSGDVGKLDEDGFLHLLDRKNDVINRGGYNIYPAEVEAALVAHPAVRDAAVVGMPHAVLGEDVRGFIVFAEGRHATTEELRTFCRELIADYKIPRRIEVLDDLPRNAMGKVRRIDLRQTAAEN